MTELTAKSTTEAKQSFERMTQDYGITIQQYHVDNGLVDTELFKTSIKLSNQKLSFCGVNAHHHNGKAENCIKDIMSGARTTPLHAVHRWPQGINASLWPAAIKHYVNIRNNVPTNFVPEWKHHLDGRRKVRGTFDSSPLSWFSGIETTVNVKEFHPFGCPVYVLDEKLQAKNSKNKWTDRSRVGIFLCHSPQHSLSVPLVLNTQTANVSPQLHCLYDDRGSRARLGYFF